MLQPGEATMTTKSSINTCEFNHWSNHTDTKSDPYPTTKQYSVASIQLNNHTSHASRETMLLHRFYCFLLLSLSLCRPQPSLVSTTIRLSLSLTIVNRSIGFWCHRLERPASPRRICAVTRGFQTTTQYLSVFPFLPRHYHMTRVLLSPFLTTVWTPVVLAIINII